MRELVNQQQAGATMGAQLQEQAEPRQGLDAASLEAATATITHARGPTASAADLGSGLEPCPDDSCMICLEPFRRGEELRLLPCMHRYHRQCVDRWLARSQACPMCKHDVLGSPAC